MNPTSYVATFMAVLDPETPDPQSKAIKRARFAGHKVTGPVTLKNFTARDGWKCVIAHVPVAEVQASKRRYAPKPLKDWPPSQHFHRRPRGQSGRDS